MNFKKSEIIPDTRSKEFLEEDVVDLRRLTKIHCDKVDGVIYDFYSSIFTFDPMNIPCFSAIPAFNSST